MKGKEGTGDPGGPDAKSGRYSSGSELSPSGENGFFADASPAITRSRGGDFSGNPRPIPVWGPCTLIRWTGPHFLSSIFNWNWSGV